METRNILVLARRDHTEAMRVAAGLTIFGHEVRLVFMTGPVAETEANAEQAELLDMVDIVPETTVAEMAEELGFLDAAALGRALVAAERVISI
jgi:hypothetical protein